MNVSAPVTSRITVAGELWSAWNFEPAGTVELISLDAAATYSVSPRFQVDAGANVGLNRHTPDLELYVGTSVRF